MSARGGGAREAARGGRARARTPGRRGARRSALAALAAVALVAGAAPRAGAYRTSQDSERNRARGIVGRIAWRTSPVRFALQRPGSDDLPLAQAEIAVQRAFSAWTAPSCTDLAVRYAGLTDTPPVYDDAEDVIGWVERGWRDRGYASFTIAVTTTELGDDGMGWAIDGADMELNGEDYRWALEGGAPGTGTVDVEALLVHEVGHYLGLLHPCEGAGGDGAPLCPATPPSPVPTMYPVFTGDEQASLERDDVDGICFLYPRAGCEATRCAPGERCDGAGRCVGGVDAGAPIDAGAGDGGPADAGAVDGGDASAADAGAGGMDAGAPPAGGGRSAGCGCAVPGARRGASR
jgi:hypothetical protein